MTADGSTVVCAPLIRSSRGSLAARAAGPGGAARPRRFPSARGAPSPGGRRDEARVLYGHASLGFDDRDRDDWLCAGACGLLPRLPFLGGISSAVPHEVDACCTQQAGAASACSAREWQWSGGMTNGHTHTRTPPMAFSHCFGSGHSSGLTDAGALEVELNLKDKSVPPSPPSCGLPVLIPMAMRVQCSTRRCKTKLIM